VDLALDPDDGGDMGLPVGVGELVGRIEDGDGAAFVAAAPDVVAVVNPERRRGGGDFRDPRVQGWLIVLDLNDQRYVGLFGDLEVFF
jgi:hypothetical protein